MFKLVVSQNKCKYYFEYSTDIVKEYMQMQQDPNPIIIILVYTKPYL